MDPSGIYFTLGLEDMDLGPDHEREPEFLAMVILPMVKVLLQESKLHPGDLDTTNIGDGQDDSTPLKVSVVAVLGMDMVVHSQGGSLDSFVLEHGIDDFFHGLE